MGSFRKKLTPKIEGYIRGILSKEDESASREKNEIPFKAVQFFVQSLEPDLEALRTFYKQSHE
jgi:hypothetical protein